MNIIEFLIKNFYVILIGLFLLSRMLGKSGERSSPTRIPASGGEDKRVIRSQPEPQKSDKDHSSVEEVEQGYVVEQGPADAAAVKRSEALYSSFAVEAEVGVRHLPKPASAAKPNMTKAELRNAFIWSELLGPPKAKRFFRK